MRCQVGSPVALRLDDSEGDGEKLVKATIRYVLLFAGFALSHFTYANGLEGLWKIDSREAWVEIVTEGSATVGVVRRNEANPDAVGRTILKDLVADDGQEGVWKGQIYAARLGEFRAVEITQVDPSQLRLKIQIGFMSRSILWSRARTLPAQ